MTSTPALLARQRLALVVLALLVLSFLALGGMSTAVAYRQDRIELSSSLERAATGFRASRAQSFEHMLRQVELLAQDSLNGQYLGGLARAPAGSPEREEILSGLELHVRETLATLGSDMLVLLGEDGKVVASALRSPPEAGPATEPEGARAASGALKPEWLPGQGEVVTLPMIDKVFGDGEPRAGYLRLRPGEPVWAVVAAPWRDGEREGEQVSGALFLARRVDEVLLARASSAFRKGLIAVLSDGELVASLDGASSLRPSPAILAALELGLSSWSPPGAETDLPAPPEASAPVLGQVQLGGASWVVHALPLQGGEPGRPAAWALFLADTSRVEERIRREAWGLAQVGLGSLLVGLSIAWLGAGWIFAPLVGSRSGPQPPPAP